MTLVRFTQTLVLNLVFCFSLAEKRRPNDFFIWKSSVELADHSLMSMDLLSGLPMGRHLLETRARPVERLLVHVLSDGVRFRHFKFVMSALVDTEVRLDGLLTAEKRRRLMYRTGVSGEEAQALRNDLDVAHLQVAADHLAFMVEVLDESNRQLCPSLQRNNDLLFALV